MTDGLENLWVVLSVAAAGFQTLRFMMQKVLSTATLSPAGATFARFIYSAPIVLVLLAVYLGISAQSLPQMSLQFWVYAAIGGLAQVTATVCTVMLFKARTFAVGVTLIKTEVLLSVLVGFVVLGDVVGLLGAAAIFLGLIGVLLLSKPPESKSRGWGEIWNKGVALGLTAGFLFSISAVSYRGASLELGSQDAALRAGVTLAAVTSMQMIGMALWLWRFDPGQVRAVWRARQTAVWIGLLSLAGSFCWFFAFTLQNAAYVKAVGQIELVFSLVASSLFFGERSTTREILGMSVLCASILILIMGT
ncbi:MAG: DMT family transporter [Pseudomonadota bacterium]